MLRARLMPDSVLTLLFRSFLSFGVLMGCIFPVYAVFFVEFKPGMAWWFVLGCLVAGISVGLFNYFLTKKILVDKIQRISEVATEISEGDLSHFCQIESNDAIGDIVQAFNRMAEGLREMVGVVQESARQVHGEMEQLDRITRESVAGSKQQVAAIRDLKATVAGLDQAFSHLIDSSEAVLAFSQATSNEAEDGKTKLMDTIRSIEDLGTQMEEMVAVIANLEHHSQQIDQVNLVINGIAKQIRQLSFNATIEASRAGEHGRGFAIVAEEVRVLASETQTSVDEIAAMTEAIQREVHQAGLKVKQGRDQARQGTQKSHEATTVLADLVDNIGKMAGKSRENASLVQEQRSVTEQVQAQLDSVAMVAEREETAMGRNESATTAARRASASLEQFISRFRV